MIQIHIEKMTMGFRIHVPVVQAEAAVLQYAQRLHAPKIGRDRGRITTEIGEAFYLRIQRHRVYFFHLEHLQPIKDVIAAAMCGTMGSYEFVESTLGHVKPYECQFKRYGFQMEVTDPESRFFYQNEVVATASQPDRFQTIFAIQTGRGKTKSAQKTMVKLGTRTVIIVRPSYIDKWEYDTCRDKTGLRERRKRVYIAKGVRGITEMLYEGMYGTLDKRRISTIMIPTTSLQLWLKDYCENPQQYTQIEIGEFYNYLKAGLVLHDEIHEHFLLVYLSAIAMNPPKLLEMSATIDPSKSKQFICDRYLERFPLSARLSVDYIPVVDVAGIYYSISDPKFCAKANRMKLYSHTTYEKNLYQHGIIDQYFDMIYDLLQRGYLNNYQSGQKALVFFSLVQTCKDFQSYLDRRLAREGWKLNTAKYNAGDSYDKFIAADIGISTPGKAGTAIDIPGLVLALVTIPIDDKQLNEQITGRPREVTAWDLTPKVLFLHCVQVSKHNRYLRSRKRELEKIVKSFKIAHSKYDLKGGKPRGINNSVHRPNLKRVPLPNSSSLSQRRGGFKRGRKKW